MLKTNYKVKNFKDWMLASKDFEEKLEVFKRISDCKAKVKMFVGTEYYGIEITITHEKN